MIANLNSFPFPLCHSFIPSSLTTGDIVCTESNTLIYNTTVVLLASSFLARKGYKENYYGMAFLNLTHHFWPYSFCKSLFPPFSEVVQ